MNQLAQWIKIAFRNIVKSKRRTIVTLFATGFGFASIALFQGYIHNIYEGLRASAIHGSGIGHLTLYTKGWEAHGKSDPDAYMIQRQNIEKITQLARKNDHITLASPRLSISGLVSNGKNSTIFIATGVIPEHERTIKGEFYDFQPITGESLNAKNEFGVEMASALAENLDLVPGSDGVVMGATLDGQMNALDINIVGTYNTGVADSNDKFIKVPFSFAQSFYDTQKADSIVILLDHWKHTDLVKQQLTDMLALSGIEVEIKTWKQLSAFYKSVRNMFDMIFLFIFVIVFIIVIMSTTNTMGMAVVERTREIGTLRALGLKRRGVSLLFAAEGGLLGLAGSIFGLLMHTLVWTVIQYVQPSYTPPGNSTPVQLAVDFLPASIIQLIFFMTFLALISAIVPARRAARQNVVNSLTHV
jgi:putative ABC transport system permease protein